MKVFILIGLLGALASCSRNNSSEKIEALNGYWNIDTVEKPDGSEKEFPFSNHMDFFETNGNKGTKSRVSPTYDGSFIVYGDPVVFTWEEKEEELLLHFEEGDAAYTQIVQKATTQELELVHEDGTIYNYKSYQVNEKQ